MKRTPVESSQGFAATTGAANSPAYDTAGVTERNVSVATPDGVADAALFHPADGEPRPAVLIWVDIMGLRPVYRDMGRRLAAQGYTVLVPNPFYRADSADEIIAAGYDFMTPEGRATLFGFRQQISDDGIVADATAFIAFLDAQLQVDTGRKAGVQGYCMGGPFGFRTAAAAPHRIGAVAVFHANGLATAEPSSPHRLIAATEAEYLVGMARNDDANNPEATPILRETFAETKRAGTVEVYPADHGWCVPGVPVYDPVQAERAWSELSELYKRALG